MSSTVERNLEWGMAHRTWGLRKQPSGCRVGQSFDWHVIGVRARGGRLHRGPRSQPEEWVTATIDVYLLLVRSSLRHDSAPLWPDEIETNQTQYPYRFDIELMATAKRVPTRDGNPLPATISEKTRLAASRAEAVHAVGDLEWVRFMRAFEGWASR